MNSCENKLLSRILTPFSILLLFLLLTPLQAQSQLYSILPDTAVPEMIDEGPEGAVELGVKFRSDVDGYITGIRFYKSSANAGSHVANLWTVGGTRLVTATFSNESASGMLWLPSCLPLLAGEVLIIG